MNAPYEFVQAIYDDISGPEAVLSQLPPQSLAAILVELMQGAGGCILGKPEFLAFLRKASKDLNALLILDEVMTSRLAYGGLQCKLGIKTDLTTLGKWIGGGMSFGAFRGRQDVMKMFDPSVGKFTH
jgi:glutamate-1-semialdehyde 2,1-aminomutase